MDNSTLLTDLFLQEASKMQGSQGAALLTLALWALCSPVLSTEGKRKLQIGVKKRVDNCPIKSRKGDVLHMHYTVSALWVGNDGCPQDSKIDLVGWG